ncbi:Uncharacterized protein YrrD, contains PRC-barrel domain [Paenibacillus sp. 1_12]|uniref:PRC-barrel domain-containing protein n=1 Tax=Paenibacillus sp. 1_12 TaxID=1566278 RepID=UPI0008E78F5F|nr:PRC-barrel domain-containing protein [Paenibacillus sp. 1_12]SFK68690.1 Uncharacterized protein YrrD, contains PRC-barrel domain [Paenibacillus sp. 1_12]
MKKARDVIGLPILCVQTGKQVGTVKDLLLDEAWQIELILLENRHWFSTASCVAWKDVIALGEDAITIHNEEAVVQLDDQDQLYISLLNGDHKVKGMPVVTVNGQHLGIVDDVYLDPELGKKVIGYELTEGFISDLKEGRKWLPLPDTVTMGEDAIIVPVHCNEWLTEIVKSNEE